MINRKTIKLVQKLDGVDTLNISATHSTPTTLIMWNDFVTNFEIIITSDGVTPKIHLIENGVYNGSIVTTNSTVGNLKLDLGTFLDFGYFDINSTTYRKFNGQIDYFALYDRKFTDTEVYSTTTAKDISENTTGLINFMNFGKYDGENYVGTLDDLVDTNYVGTMYEL